MFKNVKIVSLLLSISLLCSMLMPVYGIDSAGGSGNTDAIVNQDGTTFSVTVPTSLPISVDSDGIVSVASNVKMVNNSYGPVVIEDISVNPLNSWSIVNYNTDFREKKVGLTEFGLILNGDEVKLDGNLDLGVLNKSSIPGGDEFGINYNANVAVQKESLSNLEIANVIFTIGWDLSNVVSSPTYVLATDADFSGETDGSFRYIGTDEYVEIPHVIKGVPVTSYASMFQNTYVKGVKSTNTNVTSLYRMFSSSQAISLDLSSFDTSNVTNMGSMFSNSQATSLDLSNFDTYSVTNMGGMFYNAQATSLDLSNFDTSSVTNMREMFRGSQATSLDLSSFDTSNVTTMSYMFEVSQATTGYAKTQTDADKLNKSANKPAGLNFIVKP